MSPTSEGRSGHRARTIYLIASAYHALRATRLEPALKPLGVTPLQYTIMTVVESHEGLSSAQLSRRFYVTPQTMGQVLAGLEERGLLRRREDPENRRVLLVSLTAKGRRLVDECGRVIGLIEDEIFSDPDCAETAALREQLQKIAAHLRENTTVPAELAAAPKRRKRLTAPT
ncbi:MarR family transcriptional regulator [Luteimonas sp. BDR2-5]|uniref:MarR family winged helix-turn-helix transcriptional regulator n=1 Tax=Proluteimonas luteida TaxID=2878685 RepID=UPI001E4EE6EA|nr:MarR family transcriptional regulator [Luteimonas sp. BDR2-5]MCD9028727.1 MarR family transcriptional regulator [Luteimonas sp. BDR2-5]